MIRSKMLVPAVLAAMLGTALLSPAAEDKTKPKGPPVVAGAQLAAVPKGWKSAPPKNKMRAAQWTIPAAEKGGAAGEVVIFYFGPGQGGGAKDNIERWQRRMTAADGGEVKGDVSQRDVAGMRVTELIAYGTYAAGMPMPGFKPEQRTNYGLVGVVLEASGGNIFIRMTGPKALVDAQLPAFQKWIDGTKKA